jgi:hypothetical protein
MYGNWNLHLETCVYRWLYFAWFTFTLTRAIYLQDSAWKCDELRLVECILPRDCRQGKIVRWYSIASIGFPFMREKKWCILTFYVFTATEDGILVFICCLESQVRIEYHRFLRAWLGFSLVQRYSHQFWIYYAIQMGIFKIWSWTRCQFQIYICINVKSTSTKVSSW